MGSVRKASGQQARATAHGAVLMTSVTAGTSRSAIQVRLAPVVTFVIRVPA